MGIISQVLLGEAALNREGSFQEKGAGSELPAANAHSIWGIGRLAGKGDLGGAPVASTTPTTASAWPLGCRGSTLNAWCQFSCSFLPASPKHAQTLQVWFYLSALVCTLGTDLTLLG